MGRDWYNWVECDDSGLIQAGTPQGETLVSRNPKRGGEMNRDDPRDLEIQALRDRLSRLSEASLHINETLDLDAVLQGVIYSPPITTAAVAALVRSSNQS